MSKQKAVKFTQDELHLLYFAVKCLTLNSDKAEVDASGTMKKLSRAIVWK